MREKRNSYTNPKCYKIRPINSYRISKSAMALSLNAIHNSWFCKIRNLCRNPLLLSPIVSWTWWHSKKYHALLNDRLIWTNYHLPFCNFYLRQGGYVIVIVVANCLFVCYISNVAQKLANGFAGNFPEKVGKGPANEQTIKFWWWSGSGIQIGIRIPIRIRIRIATLVKRA